MRMILPILILAAVVCFTGCVRVPSGTSASGSSQISLNILIAQPAAKSTAVYETKYDSLIVRVSAPDMTSVTFRFALPSGSRLFTDTLANLPSGDNRLVEVWTKNILDTVIHGPVSQSVDLSPNELKTLSFVLQPRCGSIYVQLGDVPSTVDSVLVRFTSDNGTITRTAIAPRSAKLYVSLDYIPDNTTGTVFIRAINTQKDTLYRSQTHLTFSVTQNTTLPAVFASAPGGISLDVSIVNPGVTVIAGEMRSGDTVGAEYGPLIVSEIMYTPDDSEYVELYNPTSTDTTFDTLIVEIDTTKRIFTGITVKAGGFYIIGRKSLPWADSWHSTASALDLTSTGKWITVRTKTMRVIDWVAYTGGSNTLGWPNIPSAKASIALDSLPAGPAYNNYGTHWKTATSRIDPAITPVTTQLGTPGKAGI